MKIRKFATIALLVLSSFAANNVAPSKTELESMYDKAFREFDANNYEQALKDLEAIDARQPDLAESANLRGVIFMRQKDYAKAEAALQKALAADPKFWNARFNLAEIPFLQKNWPEARKRFQELLTGNASELQGEATQLIQYKILITHLMEGKQNLVDATLAKFELAPETPAFHYANAAIALHKKDENAAKEALTTAEKNFSPQLNKLFAESLYEVGWLDKPAGQTRAALELNSAAERVAKTKAFAKAKFDEAEQALQQRDLTAARKLIDEADAAEPNQPQVVNLRGEILLEQKEFDAAENEFRKAAKLDPKFRDAQYNLAQVPFKKKDYAKARERFEALFSSTSGADKDRAAQLIKYKVYLTYLLEGKDARAQKMMEQFQFTGDTPALYYAQAAWEFKHGIPGKANDWVTSARKIYAPALNGVFADAFFDLGWIQSPEAPDASAAAIADAGQPEAAPSIEPTPLPAISLAKNDREKASDPLTLAAQANSPVPGMEATTSLAGQTPPASSAIGASASPSVETPVASTASPAAAQPVIAMASPESSTPSEVIKPAATAASNPATGLAPAKVREWSQPTWGERLQRVDVILLVAGILLLAVVVIPILLRRFGKGSGTESRRSESRPTFNDDAPEASAVEQFVTPTRLAGGPPQISVQLRASEPALRRATMPLGKTGRAFGNGNGHGNGHTNGNGNGHGNGHGAVMPAAAPSEQFARPEAFAPAAAEPFEEGVGEPQPNESFEAPRFAPVEPEPVFAYQNAEVGDEQATSAAAAFVAPEPTFVAPEPTFFAPEPAFVAPEPVATTPESAFVAPEPAFATAEAEPTPVVAEASAAPLEAVATQEAEPVAASVDVEVEAQADTDIAAVSNAPADEPIAAAVASAEETSEPIGQGQPVPYLAPAAADEAPVVETEQAEPERISEQPARIAAAATALAGIGALRHSGGNAPLAPQVAPAEPAAQQSTTPATMPQPTQPTPAPVIRTGPQSPMSSPAPQQQPGPMAQATAPQMGGGGGGVGGMHTAVQLTFSTEIASLQLTPSFKMGAMQLKPTSRIVTMRLAPSQNPQPAMNLQVTFELATVQLAGNALGTVRLTPSQQQRPGTISSPSFNIAGLQLVSGSEAAPVQLTPSQQGQASVHVTAAFNIATVEFSPSFEIASIVLNANSKSVSVQLPGAGPSAIEGAPVFDITNVQLAGSGEIGMFHLNPHGAGPQRPA
ncbi:MAG TPA: tetratricopeptide repeat protein [Chthoniobacterales bacterium]